MQYIGSSAPSVSVITDRMLCRNCSGLGLPSRAGLAAVSRAGSIQVRTDSTGKIWS